MLYRLMGSPSYSRGTLRFSDVTGATNEDAIYYAVSAGGSMGMRMGRSVRLAISREAK